MPDGFFPRFIQAVTGETPEAQREYREYQRRGGGLSQIAWLRQGKPAPPAQLTPYARDILARTGGVPPGVTVTPPTEIPPARRIEQQRAEREAAGVDLGAGVRIPPYPTESPPSGFRWAFDRDLNRWVPQFAGLTAQQQVAREISPFQQQQFELQQQQAQQEEAFRQQQLEFQQAQQEQAQQQFRAQLQFQQEQAQMAAEEQERQYRSQLAAQPINWLQYSAYTGEQPVIQPWMVPLGFQGGAATPQGFQAGQPIPGFQGEAGQQGIQTFANLPQLTTPSAQLQARWGPTAQAQFLGYRQARTGAAPAETQFRLGAGRAPAGRFPGFSRFSRV